MPVPKNIFGGFTIYRRGGHLGHVTIQNLVQNVTVVSEKIRFEFLNIHDHWPRSRNDLDFLYSQTFIKSISCLHLPTFRSQASKVSEKFTVFPFSHRKPLASKIVLAVK